MLYVIGAVLVGTALFLLVRAFWIRAGLTLARVAIALAIAVVTFGVIALVVAGKLSWIFAAGAALVAFGNRLLGVLSVLHFDKTGVPMRIVGQSVLAALAANAAVRFSLAAAAGRRTFSLLLAAANSAAVAGGVAAYLLVPSV